jgi:hypothetical protein
MADDEFCSFQLQNWPAVTVTLNRPPRDADAEIPKFQSDFCGLLALAVQGDVEAGIAPTRLFLTMGLDGIVDATLAQQLSAATFIQSVKPLVEAGALQATALVITSERARSVLQCILTIAPLTSRYAIFSTHDEATKWLASQGLFAPN